MKKYCLTDCFKKKLSSGKKALIEFITAMAVVVIVVIVGIIVFAIIGFCIQLGYYLINGNLIGFVFKGFIEAGFMSSLLVALMSLLLYLFIIGIKDFLYIPIKAVVTNKMTKKDVWGEETVCHIFEECISEEEIDGENYMRDMDRRGGE